MKPHIMIFRGLNFLIVAASLVYSTVPAVASPVPDRSQPTVCPKPRYPYRALKLEEEGVTLIAFLVRADGTVSRSVILNSSGFADLDEAAADALSQCVFQPATEDGKAVESWAPAQYRWFIDNDPELRRAKHTAAVAATKGNLAARYNLSLLLSSTATTDDDRERALIVLRSAAELGNAAAQYDLGRHCEKGHGVKADVEEALRWYQKAAAQGDVLAIQRLRLGALPD